jgi:hypothetical protein
MLKILSPLIFALLALPTLVQAELRPDKVHVADSKKTQAYIRDGLITGGDKAIDEVMVKDIRRAANAGYERIVVDLEGTANGEPAAINRPPYFQISVTPDERRIVFTIWGKPKLGFDSRRVVNAFKRSTVIQSVELLPRVEDNTWSFVFGLKGESPVEVFELSNPVRIIMDIKADPKTIPHESVPAPAHSKHSSKAKPKAKAKAKVKVEAPHAKPAPAVSGLDAVPEEMPAAEATSEEHH